MRIRGLVPLLVVTGALVPAAPVLAADETEAVPSVTVSAPSAVATGQTFTVTVRAKNTTTARVGLGSMNMRVPDGYRFAGSRGTPKAYLSGRRVSWQAGGTLEPGAVRRVRVVLRAPMGSGNATLHGRAVFTLPSGNLVDIIGAAVVASV